MASTLSQILHALDELSRFGCPADALSPVHRAIAETHPEAQLSVQRFPRLLSWLCAVLGCDDAAEALQLDLKDASGEALLRLLQTCLYLQKASQYPKLVQQATAAAEFAAEHLPVAVASDYSSGLFPPGVYVYLYLLSY